MAKWKFIIIGCLMAGSLMISAVPVLARERHHNYHRRAYTRHERQDYYSSRRVSNPISSRVDRGGGPADRNKNLLDLGS